MKSTVVLMTLMVLGCGSYESVNQNASKNWRQRTEINRPDVPSEDPGCKDIQFTHLPKRYGPTSVCLERLDGIVGGAVMSSDSLVLQKSDPCSYPEAILVGLEILRQRLSGGSQQPLPAMDRFPQDSVFARVNRLESGGYWIELSYGPDYYLELVLDSQNKPLLAIDQTAEAVLLDWFCENREDDGIAKLSPDPDPTCTQNYVRSMPGRSLGTEKRQGSISVSKAYTSLPASLVYALEDYMLRNELTPEVSLSFDAIQWQSVDAEEMFCVTVWAEQLPWEAYCLGGGGPYLFTRTNSAGVNLVCENL